MIKMYEKKLINYFYENIEKIDGNEKKYLAKVNGNNFEIELLDIYKEEELNFLDNFVIIREKAEGFDEEDSVIICIFEEKGKIYTFEKTFSYEAVDLCEVVKENNKLLHCVLNKDNKKHEKMVNKIEMFLEILNTRTKFRLRNLLN